METKFRALDLFCGAGGATRGLQRAGFYVVGVDIKSQPRYCGDEFFQADALTFQIEGFDFVWASPPCQANIHGINALNRTRGRSVEHRDIIPETRRRLVECGAPYIIENVKNARLHFPVRLCGSSFGLGVRRHRYFESGLGLMALPCDHARQRELKYPSRGCPKKDGTRSLSTVAQVYGKGGNAGDTKHWPDAMQIHWMTLGELTQAIPPAYSEFLGRQVVEYLKASKECATVSRHTFDRTD